MTQVSDYQQKRLQLINQLQDMTQQASLKGHKLALFLLEVHDFKKVTANLGFTALELITHTLKLRLIDYLKQSHLLMQLSVDSFAVIAPHILNQGHTKIIANRVLSVLGEPIEIEQQVIELQGSIGVALFPDDTQQASELLERANIALVNSEQNPGQVNYFKPEYIQQVKRQWDVQQELAVALKDNQFELFYQPKIRLKDQRLEGAEALIRWNHPLHQVVSPALFVPIAENTGQILELTDWVIKAALRQLKEIRKSYPHFVLSINISANILGSPDLVNSIKDALSIWGLPHESLIIEVTESSIMADANHSLSQLAEIKQLGVGVSIDDFGTGYSSLSYFKNIPATELKIDRVFIANLLNHQHDNHIVALIIDLAKKFSLNVVAEGIESSDILDKLTEMQCDYAQGYYFSKPLDFYNFLHWAKTYSKHHQAF